ncbi:MAG: DUF1501 domain-containing protein [Planctomycetes bacterium]|nr:DUF1501 domain-containing protein [Planctomycetota bacterium]
MIDRRNLLRGALLGAGASMFSSKVLASAGKALGIAGLPPTNHQLLFVFQRGGNDGVNTLIPMRDLTYPQARPTLKITNGIQLPGIPYSRLNPNLERLVQIDQQTRLAMIHQVGDPSMSRSHFTAMDMFEKGLLPTPPPTQAALAQATGFVPKMLAQAGVAPFDSNTLPAALSISGLMQTMFRAGTGDQVSAHVRDLSKIGAPAIMQAVGVDGVSLQHGLDHAAVPPTNLDEQLGYELAFGHGTDAALQGLGFTHAFASTGRFPFDASELATAAAATGSTVVPTFDPKGAALMAAAEQAVFTLVHSPSTRVVGIEMGGWDTHANQAAEHPNLLRYLGWALRDMNDEILANGLGNRITIVVVTEFGRTALENGANPPGTDHGAGGAWFVVGDNIVSGTHNVHAAGGVGAREFGAPWTDLTTLTDDAVPVATGLRDVLAELMLKRMGVPIGNLQDVLESYPASTASFLDFLV